jgi:hypothetical protein
MLRSLVLSGALLVATPMAFAQQATKPVEAAKGEKATSVAAVVESTLTTDGGMIRQFAFDGKADTHFTSTKPPAAADHFTLTFDQPVTVKAVTVTTGKSKGGDELAAGVLEGSADGKAFEQLAKFADGKATATPGKKLKALRVKVTEEAKVPLVVREFTLDADPAVTTFKYPVEIVPNADDAPDMKEWLEQVARTCEKQYPMICEELKGDGYTPPTLIKMTLKKDYNGVAAASGTRITGSVKYFEKKKDDVGAFVHETVHCVQQYGGRGNPGWLVEGVADYVRFFKYEANKPKPLAPEKAKYDGSYRTTAAFLAYLVDTRDKEIVRKLNDTMRKGKYTADVWKELTGKPVEELGREWQKSLAK